MKYIKYISLWALAALSLTACGDDNDWTPGNPDTDCGTAAYFPEQSVYKMEFEGQPDDCNFNVTVNRLDASQEVTIPLSYTSEVEGWTVPESITFAQGQESLVFEVNCGGLPKNGVYYTVNVTLPADQNYIYAGTGELNLQAARSNWTIVCDQVTYKYLDYNNYSKQYPNTYGVLKWQWDPINKIDMFRVTDYYATGLTVDFTITDPEREHFVPVCKEWFDWNSSGNYYLWNIKGDYALSWNPDGEDSDLPAISEIMFYGSSSYSMAYMINDAPTLYGWVKTIVDLTWDGTWKDETYGYWYFDFYLAFNPFEVSHDDDEVTE